MATKLNSEFNYRTQVEGITPWARIKNLQGFLEGRVRAAALEEVAAKKLLALRSELDHERANHALDHVILRLEAKLIELESHLPTQAEAFALNLEEIEIIKNLIAEQYTFAEHTRLPGYTDEQMFEANAEYEFTVWLAMEIHADILAHGRPSPAHVRNAMSSPKVFASLMKIGLIPQDNNVLKIADTGLSDFLVLNDTNPMLAPAKGRTE